VDIPTGVELNAWQRQGGDGRHDALCAKCGALLDAGYFKQSRKGGWCPAWRVSKEDGGDHTTDNCICLCPECCTELRQNNTTTIPVRNLPHYSMIR
jgi:hypothetical protein